ncbi:hypothetical protein SIN8267_03469 [Sinobacterium norvegicum]|uniref:Cyclic nucleotide-binding domain-containing protein n=1 Tax=Sinobacterium norvegicum TaxID=1641715 RepID=A0ABM9AJS9_9GAMM|nr:cyclic nucleotide-binding domain-containing protein [Sinobacterium norvegicum]CAH0993321.1 hypothetical protein SIN8267_03469 [Sinobacterium norvegicum]
MDNKTNKNHSLTQQITQLSQTISEKLTPITQADKHKLGEGNTLSLISKGRVEQLTADGKTRVYSTGMLIPSRTLALGNSDSFYAVNAEFSHYSSEQLSENVELSQLWTSLLFLYTYMAGNNPNSGNRPELDFIHFAAGDVIIQQGDRAKHVYSLITGHAEVCQNDKKIGDVHEDEIFGAMAAFNNSIRNATVTAKTACTVVATRQDQFISLMQSHPKICQNLIDTMSRQINDLNQQLSSGSEDA